MCLIFHNEALFGRHVQRFRLVLPVQALCMCEFDGVTPLFAQNTSVLEAKVALNSSIQELFSSILAYKDRKSVSFLIISTFLRLQLDKMQRRGASLQTDLLSSAADAVHAAEIEAEARAVLKAQKAVQSVQ